YSNDSKSHPGLLDESCPIEEDLTQCDAYSFAKIKQDAIVTEYGNRLAIPYVIVRPGYVIGPGKSAISGRVGIGTFGIFLHLGGPNRLPLTYVDNCADAIVLAGLRPGIEGQVFNIVDDDLPSSRRFLRLYKKKVAGFRSLYLPHFVSYLACICWERYSRWSQGQLEPAFNESLWRRYWKTAKYSNGKAKHLLGWSPLVPMDAALNMYFDGCRRAHHSI